MDLIKNLKLFSSGEQVAAAKNQLVFLGYLTKATNNRFGTDTLKAVKTFQAANGLQVDGIIGPMTWAALFARGQENPVESCYDQIPLWITAAKRRAIADELDKVSFTRRKICLSALQLATDPDLHGTLCCFYIRGGNAYNQDLSLNVMTEGKLRSYFGKTSYAPYYDNGRKEMMEAQAKASNYSIAGADCSGLIVGLWRKEKVKSAGFDANANSLYGSFCVPTTNPIPGDLAWKSGHIGLYVGGYIVEAIGGEYGVQVTKANNRKAWSYTRKKLVSLSKWTAYGDPKCY